MILTNKKKNMQIILLFVGFLHLWVVGMRRKIVQKVKTLWFKKFKKDVVHTGMVRWFYRSTWQFEIMKGYILGFV